LLLCLGDHADESGHAYPSLDRLADRCTLTKRSVISTLNLLEKDGWLKRIKKGRKSEYQIMLAKLGIGEATSSITLPTGEEHSRMTSENASPRQAIDR
jgi:predicted transcriptional regulator of viral defense system